MAINVGDTLPMDLKLKEPGDAGPKDVTVGEIFKGKRVVIFASEKTPRAIAAVASVDPSFTTINSLSGEFLWR